MTEIEWARASLDADKAMDAFLEEVLEAAARHQVQVQRIDISAFRGRDLFRRVARPCPDGTTDIQRAGN